MRIILILGLLLMMLQDLSAQKINGVNFVGTSTPLQSGDMDPILNVKANHVCFVPFAYGTFGSSELKWKNLEWQWWGESLNGVRESIRIAHKKGLKTIVKPQIWFNHGTFTGNFSLDSEQEWEQWESHYREYILDFALLAQEEGVVALCIGTELCKFVEARPRFWSELIDAVRTVYSGKLTYAANWDSFSRFPHWNKLDYIGIDAYFPLCEQQTPKLKTLLLKWQEHFEPMEKLSMQVNRPVLFTEFGYRSTDYCAKEPWDSSRGGTANEEAQYNSYLALFRRFWSVDWFAGGLLWKWYPAHGRAGGPSNNRFTPQNKMAEKLIREWYSRF